MQDTQISVLTFQKLACKFGGVIKTHQLMKKILLSIAMVVAGAAAYAQVNQGNIMLGGTLYYQSADNGSGTSESVFGLGANGGYFLSDGLAVGAKLAFQGEDKGGIRSGNKSEFTFGLFGRKYMELGSGFYMYGNLGFDYMMRKTAADADNNGFMIGAEPGFAWFPAPKWGIHMGLGNWIYFYNNTDAKSSGFGLTPQVGGMSLSVNYFLGK